MAEYSIQQLAQLSGVTTRTLRWYDTLGLLKPKRVQENGYRRYTEADVDRLQDIFFTVRWALSFAVFKLV